MIKTILNISNALPAASRLAGREKIFPSSALDTLLDRMDRTTIEEKGDRKPITEPANSTQPR